MKILSGKNTFFFILLLFLTFPAAAGLPFTGRAGETIIIQRGEVIDEDLYLAGRSVIMEGTVQGDLWVSGSDIIIRGKIRDDLFVAGRKVVVSADVGEGVKILGETISLEGNILGDAMLAANIIHVQRTSRLGRDLLFGSREASVEGEVWGDIRGGAEQISIQNRVKGDVKLWGKKITLGSGASLGGDFTYVSENQADIHPEALITGSISRRLPEYREKIAPYLTLAAKIGKVVAFIMAMITGLFLVILFPRWISSMADALHRKPGPSAGWGAVVLFGAPAAVIIAAATVVGIPVGTIILFVYLVSLFISQVPVSFYIGRLIIGRLGRVERRAVMYAAFVLGLAIIRALRFIPVFGWVAAFAVVLFGLGAIVVSERTRRAMVA